MAVIHIVTEEMQYSDWELYDKEEYNKRNKLFYGVLVDVNEEEYLRLKMYEQNWQDYQNFLYELENRKLKPEKYARQSEPLP